MAKASLLIAVEGGADMQRAFGNIVNASKRANAAMSADTRRTDRERVSSGRSSQRELDRIVSDGNRAALRDIAQKAKEAEKAQKQVEKWARQELKIIEAASRQKERLRAVERRDEERNANALVRVREAAERRVTAVMISEQRARSRRVGALLSGAAGVGGAAVGFVGRALGAADQFAGQALDAASQTRARRAVSGQALNEAFFQAGATRSEIGAANDRSSLAGSVYGFARTNRMDATELSAAINQTQTEFSTMNATDAQRRRGLSDQQARGENLQAMLHNALLARNTGQDMSQVMRVSAMLQNAGITGSANRATLLGMTGMAQQGAVELGSVIREGMQPMMARMHDARSRLLQRNPDASEAQIAEAQRGAALQTFAEVEVARSHGAGVRRFANVMAQLDPELQSTNRQHRLLTNIERSRDISDAQRTQLRGMFDHGRLRDQYTTGLTFASRVNEITGGNESLMRNIFAGGGHGNAQGLQANWRNAIAMMMSGGGDVQRLVHGIGTDMTEQRVAEGSQIFGESDAAVLQGQQEERDSAIAAQQALTTLASDVSRFNAEHPFSSMALDMLPFSNLLRATAANQLYANGGLENEAVERVSRQHVRGYQLEGALDRERGNIVVERTQAALRGVQAMRASGQNVTPQQMAQMLAAALQGQPLRIELSPVAASHLASQSGSGPNGAPAPSSVR